MAEPLQPKPNRRPWWRWPLRLLVALGVFLAVAPGALSINGLRNWLLGSVPLGLRGSVEIEKFQFGWLTPLEVRNLAIRDLDGEPVITIAGISGDRTLLELLFRSSDLGHLQIDRPRAYVVATSTKNNFRQTFPQLKEPPAPDGPPPKLALPVNHLSLHLTVNNAAVSWRLFDDGKTWMVDKLPLDISLVPSSAQAPGGELVIAPLVILDRTEASPGLCSDALKYIAPVLTDVTQASGAVTLAIDGSRMPLDDLSRGPLTGRLTLHEVDVGPGPLVASIAQILSVPAMIPLARDSTVEFKLVDHRFYHHGLRFGLAPVLIETAGSVGIDHTLDLIAQLDVDLPAAELEGRPLLKALSQHTLKLPIRGRLDKPEIDASGLGETGLGLLKNTFLKLTQPPSDGAAGESLLDVISRWRSGGILGPAEDLQPVGAQEPGMLRPGEPASGPMNPAPGGELKDIAVDVLQELARRRRERQERNAAERTLRGPPPGNAGPSENGDQPRSPSTDPRRDSGDLPRRRPLGRLIDRLREPAAEAIDRARAPVNKSAEPAAPPAPSNNAPGPAGPSNP